MYAPARVSGQETDTPRDPFWPARYAPGATNAAPAAAPAAGRPAAPAVNAENWAAARAQMRLGGVSRIGEVSVLVNDRERKVGDLVTVAQDGRMYRWRVQLLAGDRPHLAPVDALPAP